MTVPAQALPRWSLETSAGRGVIGLCGLVVLVWCVAGGETIARSGNWRGFDRSIAPHEGRITIEGTDGDAGRCTVRGDARTATGNGWFFRGKTTVREVACDIRITNEGTVSALLEVRMEWHGRIKGIGGDDWDDADGYGDCAGPLTGDLRDGNGRWHGECRNERHRWSADFEWALDAE